MTSETLPVIALREPKQVPLDQVERELSRIWATQEGGQLATRASTFNFLVYASGQTTNLSDVIGAVAVQYPCRTLTISEDLNVPVDGVQTEVTAYCPLSSGGQPATVCCEYVSLKAQGQTLRELYTTVLPLLIPDLPTYLWWQGALSLEDHLFAGLLSLSERLIVDSGTSGEAVDLLVLSNLDEIAIGDLNWWRLLPWRELTAKAFDNENRLAALSLIHCVTLEYGQSANLNRSQVLLFLAWLAGRLGWQAQGWLTNEVGEQTGIKYQAGDQTIEAVWQAVVGSAGALTSVRMDLAGENYLLIRSGLIAECVQVQLEEEGVCTFEQVAALQEPGLDLLLAQELQTPSQTDALYREALSGLQELFAQ